MLRIQKRLVSVSSVVARASSIAEPIFYYTRVTGSFLSQVASHSKLTQFPDPGKGITSFVNGLTNGAWRKVTLKQAGELVGEGVKIGGFFLVGEMIGKGSVIGYQLEGASSHHH